ncbi:hypothetical protein B0J13DRAFT_103824 [Dactylonectria estremocensis]|uniref:Uncharacterized protein n=1 Tax=Dactylonectria estremocensis TaxID=1079267 RepID=A0A9P9IT31_9HYPO|nr:hypothetical protein B0J13DRAFT_103824 [Dactylonectria estremocensis]
MPFHVPKSRHDISSGVPLAAIWSTCVSASINAFTALFHPTSSGSLLVEILENGYRRHHSRWSRFRGLRWSPLRLHSLVKAQSSTYVGAGMRMTIECGRKGCQWIRNRYGPTIGCCSYCSRQDYRHVARDKQYLVVNSLLLTFSIPLHLPAFRSGLQFRHKTFTRQLFIPSLTLSPPYSLLALCLA